jgi:hypothetical protein
MTLRNRFRQIPKSGRIGLLASGTAILLWALEHLSEPDGIGMVFAFSTAPFKLAIFVASLFFVSDLSRFLAGHFRLAMTIAVTLIAITWAAMLAYLPFRQSFVQIFDADQYHWYDDKMAVSHEDLQKWKTDWSQKKPHLIEASMVAVFYGTLMMVCAFRRWRVFGGSIAIAVGAYLFLELTPLYFALLVWDYDEFLKGIVFDSISLDISPLLFWWPCDFSIFLYVFSFIFFSVTAAFIAFMRRREHFGVA